jgi:hypothetical protein
MFRTGRLDGQSLAEVCRAKRLSAGARSRDLLADPTPPMRFLVAHDTGGGCGIQASIDFGADGILLSPALRQDLVDDSGDAWIASCEPGGMAGMASAERRADSHCPSFRLRARRSLNLGRGSGAEPAQNQDDQKTVQEECFF